MKIKSYALSVLFLLPLLGWACDSGTSVNPPPERRDIIPQPPITRQPPTPRLEPIIVPNPNAPKVFKDHWSTTPKGTTVPGRLAPSFGRYGRRVSVDQLRQTIPRLFGGISWDYVSGGRTINRFDTFARTLGEADYLQVTESTRDSTSLFMKFMDDMAGDVCKRAVAADLKETDLSKRQVIRYEDVNKTLRFLRLKFHAIYVPEGSTESIQQLRSLYDNIATKTKSTTQAWEGVCIALLTAPEFFVY